MEAKRFLYTHLYNAPELRREHEEPDRIIRLLFQAWVAHPERMPSAHLEEISDEGAPRVVADYIAGMTDQYILGPVRNNHRPIRADKAISPPATKRTHTESKLKGANHNYLTHDQREWPCEANCLDGESRKQSVRVVEYHWTGPRPTGVAARSAVARAASTFALQGEDSYHKRDVHCRVLPSILCLSNAHASQDEDTRKD